MEFINKYKYYLIFGLIFIIGVIMLIIGSSHRNPSDIVIDDTLYYIELVGDNDITIYKGEEYIEPGYRGYDDDGNNLTDKVQVSNNIDINNPGTYKIIYSLESIVKERTIKVINKDPGDTYIHLFGEVNTILYVGDEYVEKNCEVIDTLDGTALNKKVKIEGKVDTSRAGVYKISYSVTNSSGITTTAVRTVIVMDSEMSVSLGSSGYTNGNVKINVYVNDDYFDYLLLPNGEKVKEKIYTYEVSENETYKFIMYNKKNKSIEKSIEVKNINKTKPSGSCSGSYKDGKSTINIKASDDIGIARYEIEGSSYTNNQITINKEIKTANITIYDKANNSTSISCKLEDKNKEKIPSGSFKVTDGPMPYYIYIPPGATTGMPMLIWLHGDTPREEWVASDRLGVTGYKAGVPFILVKPFAGTDFCRDSNRGWYKGGLLPIVKNIADTVCEKYKCDKKNINIGGHSRGAIGTWIMVSQYPGYFHAAAPVSCCAFYDWNPANYKGVKVWAIRGSGAGEGDNNDDIYGGCMQGNVNSVKKYAKEVRYTILPNTTHGDATNNLDGEFFKFLISD